MKKVILIFSVFVAVVSHEIDDEPMIFVEEGENCQSAREEALASQKAKIEDEQNKNRALQDELEKLRRQIKDQASQRDVNQNNGILLKGKRAYQSSLLQSYLPMFALDGDRTTVSHTSEKNSYFVVALLGTYRINSVKVFVSPIWGVYSALPLSVASRLHNSDWVTCGTISGVAEYGKEYSVVCNSSLASHVKLFKGETLSLADVEVYGEPVDMGYELISRGKPATQSSVIATGAHMIASLAVDGNTQHVFASTEYNNPAWWQVNLKGEYRVHMVRIYNTFRDYQDGARLSSVQVFTQPPNSGEWKLCGSLNEPSAVPGGVYEVNCKGVPATQVRLQLAVPEFLQLVEVEVYGKPQ